MSGVADRFAEAAPGVESANSVRQGEYIHTYRGTVDTVNDQVRLFTLAPQITDDTVYEAFRRVTGQWLNPSNHTNIVSVYDRGAKPRPWVAVTDIDGQSLEGLQPPLSVPDVQFIVDDIAEALRNANLYNTSHLDLTPTDIWVVKTEKDRRALVDGWGLERACRVAADETPLSPFTAPELVDDPKSGSEQTDVYGMAAVIYYALTGQPPVTDSELEQGIKDSSVSPPSSQISELPASVDDVLLTALSQKPSNRYDSAYEFQTALTRAIPGDLLSNTETEINSTDADAKANHPTEDEKTPTDHDSSALDGSGTQQSDERHSLTRRAAVGLLGFGAVVGVPFFISRRDTTSRDSDTSDENIVNSTPSGRVQWSFETGNDISSSPTVVDGTVYIGSDDTNIYAISAENGSEQWTYQTGDYVESEPAVVDDTVYFGGIDGNMYALSAKDGTEQWTFKTGEEVFSSPVVNDSTVYIGSNDNRIYALSAEDGIEQWSHQVGDSVSSVAVEENSVFVTGDDSVYALSADDGAEQWSFQADGIVQTKPAVVDSTVYVGSEDTNVYALSAEGGTEQWSYETGDSVYSSPTVVGGTVYVGSLDHIVYALSAETGTRQWVSNIGAAVWPEPAVRNDTVYIGSNDNRIYALSAEDGDMQWRFQTGGPVYSSPAVMTGTVYIGSLDGNVYALKT